MTGTSGGAGDLRVSGLICTKDRRALLGEAVRSLAVALGDDGELVVVAAGADTGLEDLGPATRVLRSSRPGKSRQLNQGLLDVGGDLVVCIDDDCRVEPDWVGAMAAPFEDPAVGAVFGPVRGLDGAGREVGPGELVPGPAPARTWHYANGAAMALRRAAVLEVGGLDERLGPGAALHGEEHDLVLRLVEAGWLIAIADAPAVEHVGWRTPAERHRNLLVYSRGAGAFIGAALRRDPARWWRLPVRRLRYELRQWRFWREEGPSFGPRVTVAFLRGLLAGLRLEPRRWL